MNTGTATTTVYPSAGTHNYTAITTDANGCSATSNQITVTVLETPKAKILANYCVGNGKIALTAVGGLPGATFDWRDSGNRRIGNDGSNPIEIDIVDRYSVTITNPNGCSNKAFLDISNELVTDGSFTNTNGALPTDATFSFSSQYQYQQAPAVRTGNGVLYNDTSPVNNGYAIVNNGQQVHSNFWGIDRTQNATGNKNFMIVNGHGNYVVWQQQVDIKPNTDYYFSAWAMSVNGVGAGNCPSGACGTTYNYAALSFAVNGTQVGQPAILGAGPTNATQANNNDYWTQFYSDPKWNSGTLSGTVTLSIVDLNCCLGGNDFGLDDISFGTLKPLPLTIDVTAADVCEGDTMKLYSNIQDGLEPITYSWTGPNGFVSDKQNPVIPNAAKAINEGTYTLTATDGYGCPVTPDQQYVTVFTASTVDAGPDQTACTSNPVVALSGSGTWTNNGGDGVFNALNTTYTLGPNEVLAGVATLTLTSDDPAGPCGSAVDNLVITIFNSLEISASSVSPLCYDGSDGTATVAITKGSTPPYNYLWSDGQTTAIATGLSAGTYTVTATDANGCKATATVDVTQPEPFFINAIPFITPLTCYGANDGTATIFASGGTEPYTFQWSGVPGSTNTSTVTGLSPGAYNVFVSDANGCTATNIQVVIPMPDPPFLSCPPDVEDIIASNGCSMVLGAVADPVYTGFCTETLTYTMTGATTTAVPVIGTVTGKTFNVGVTTVTYTVTDASGNTASCSFTVTILRLDIPPAVVKCPASPASVTAPSGSCAAAVIVDAPVINDPCATATYTFVNSFNGTADASGNYPVGTTTVTWTITDNSGNTTTCTQTVTVEDNQKPTISCNGDIEDFIVGNNCDLVSSKLSDPVIDDNCPPPALTYHLDFEDGTVLDGTGTVTNYLFPLGKTQVTYTVTDVSTNTATCTFQVWIKNIDKPKFAVTCPTGSNQDIVVSAESGVCDASVTVSAPAVDNPCNEVFSVTYNGSTVSPTLPLQSVTARFAIGTHTITWVITDASNTTHTCTQTVTVIDDIVPQFTFCPPSFSEPADFEKLFATNVDIPLQPTFVADNCTTTLSWTIVHETNGTVSSSVTTGINYVPTPYPQLDMGVNKVTYTLSDGSNTSTCTFSITITAKPVIDCPGDIVTNTTVSDCTSSLNPGFPELISGTQTITWTWTITNPAGLIQDSGTFIGSDAIPGPPDIGNKMFQEGTSTVTWTATNLAGTTSCTHTVTVEDKEPPTFTLPLPFSECVERIQDATYDAPTIDITPARPEYYTFVPLNNYALDLPLLLDNCCATASITVNWRIEFTDPANPSGAPASTLSGTGQLSKYTTSILFPGDGVTFLDVVHHVFYWAEDCHGNKTTPEQSFDVTITPRPQIIKMNY